MGSELNTETAPAVAALVALRHGPVLEMGWAEGSSTVIAGEVPAAPGLYAVVATDVAAVQRALGAEVPVGGGRSALCGQGPGQSARPRPLHALRHRQVGPLNTASHVRCPPGERPGLCARACDERRKVQAHRPGGGGPHPLDVRASGAAGVDGGRVGEARPRRRGEGRDQCPPSALESDARPIRPARKSHPQAHPRCPAGHGGEGPRRRQFRTVRPLRRKTAVICRTRSPMRSIVNAMVPRSICESTAAARAAPTPRFSERPAPPVRVPPAHAQMPRRCREVAQEILDVVLVHLDGHPAWIPGWHGPPWRRWRSTHPGPSGGEAPSAPVP